MQEESVKPGDGIDCGTLRPNGGIRMPPAVGATGATGTGMQPLAALGRLISQIRVDQIKETEFK